MASVLERKQLEESPLADLHALAAEVGIEGYRRLRRDDLISALLRRGGGDGAAEPEPADGPVAGEADALSGARRESRPREEAGGRESAGREPRPRTPRPRTRRPRRGAEAPAERADAPDDSLPPSVATEEPAPRESTAKEPAAPEEDGEGAEVTRTGVLHVLGNGSGFMRDDPYRQADDDVYVSPAQIRRCELRSGDEVTGPVRSPRRSERHPSLVRVETVNGAPSEPPAERPWFDALIPTFPTERLPGPEGLDAVPFGRGSRVAVSGPPGAGATTLLRGLASALAEGGAEVAVVLGGVRPEEVAEWQAAVSAPVVGGAFDSPPDERAQAAEVVLERAKRRTEAGGHAALLVDGLDGLPEGLSRRLFGAARRAEEGGSLTVVAAVGDPRFERWATTSIVLDAPEGDRLSISARSRTLRAELLK